MADKFQYASRLDLDALIKLAQYNSTQQPRANEIIGGQGTFVSEGSSDQIDDAMLNSYNTIGSVLGGIGTGSFKTASNGRIIVSTLCPFVNIPGDQMVNNDILNNISSPSKFPVVPGENRVAHIQKWLNIFYNNSSTLNTILVKLPNDKYEVDIPGGGLQNNTMYNYVRNDMLYYLEQIRDKIEKKFSINKLHISSAYRDPRYNAEMGYVDYDTHIIGCAVDIVGSPQVINYIESLAKAMRFGGIGKGDTLIHLDLNSNARWVYE